jgi:outer membrane immunogenic protein
MEGVSMRTYIAEIYGEPFLAFRAADDELARLEAYRPTRPGIFQLRVLPAGYTNLTAVMVCCAQRLCLMGTNMKQRIAAFAIIGALGFTSPSLAADMPVRAPAAPAAFTWTGIYIGAHAGGGQAGIDMTFPHENFFTGVCALPPGTFPCGPHQNTLSGFLAGGHLGFNYQVGMWVFGIEGAGTWTDFDTRVASPELGGTTWAFEMDWIASVTGRIGVAGGPDGRLLGYVKGGWAASRIRTRLEDLLAFPATRFDDDEVTHHGWTAGVGIEWAFWDNWIFGIEYNHYEFEDKRHSGPGPFFTAATPCSITTGRIGCDRDVEAKVDTVTARLSYKFNLFAPAVAPVTARY